MAAEFAEFLTHAREGYTRGGYAWVVRTDPDHSRSPCRTSTSRTRGCCWRWAVDPRVLLAMGRGADGWGPAGGGREDGESYEAAAEREVREETGVECEVVTCRRVRRATFRSEGAETARAHTLWVYFVARETGGSIDVQETELDGAAWFHDPPRGWHWAVEESPWTWEAWPGE